MFIASQVPVQLYFHKKRALASSLAVLGSGLGKYVALRPTHTKRSRMVKRKFSLMFVVKSLIC